MEQFYFILCVCLFYNCTFLNSEYEELNLQQVSVMDFLMALSVNCSCVISHNTIIRRAQRCAEYLPKHLCICLCFILQMFQRTCRQCVGVCVRVLDVCNSCIPSCVEEAELYNSCVSANQLPHIL